MTNLEWLQKAGMITINCAFNKECEEIGLNIVINLRNKDYESFDEKGFGWLLQEHKEPIKLKQWEYDTIKYHGKLSKFNDIHFLMAMKNKGYFKDMNSVEKCSMTIKEILENCEVVE